MLAPCKICTLRPCRMMPLLLLLPDPSEEESILRQNKKQKKQRTTTARASLRVFFVDFRPTDQITQSCYCSRTSVQSAHPYRIQMPISRSTKLSCFCGLICQLPNNNFEPTPVESGARLVPIQEICVGDLDTETVSRLVRHIQSILSIKKKCL